MKIIAKFINSIYFIILVNLITVILWYYKLPIITYIIYVILCILILLSNANRAAIATLLLSAIIAYQIDESDYLKFHSLYAKIFIPLGIVGIILFGIDLIKRRKTFKLKPIFYGFLIILIANIFSLINVIGKEKDLIFISILGVLQLLAYLIVYLYLSNSTDDNSKKYISNVCLVTASAITLQLIIHYLSIGTVSSKQDNDLSWAVSNTIAMFYFALIPLGLYNYFRDQKNFFVAFVNGINFFMILFMLSRGAYFSLAVVIIPVMILFTYLANDKKRFVIDFVSIFVVCLTVAYTLGSKLGIVDMLKEYFKDIDFFDDSGREELYKIGFNLFKEYPIFGAGSYSGAFFLKDKNLGTYHNYIIQTIATTGIVGLISLGYFLFTIVKQAFNKNKYNLLLLASLLYLLVHGLVDNSIYNPVIMIFLSVTISFIEKKNEDLGVLMK